MAGAGNKNDAIWRRRLLKRLGSLGAVKASFDYLTSQERPQTPDPRDRSMSERRWEQIVQDFRRTLRNKAPQNLLGEQGQRDPQDILELSSLIGLWVDGCGSTYKVIPGRKGALHVETTRPCGEVRITQNLLRYVVVRGREHAVWGKCRYGLQLRGPDELLWQGCSSEDVFLWRWL